MASNKRGVRQRLGITPKAKADAESHDDAPMSKWLKTMVAKGRMTAKEATGAATAAVESGASSSSAFDLQRVAALHPKSSAKSATKHTSRDLLKLMAKDSKLPPPYEAETMFWDATKLEPKSDIISILPPHELLDSLVEPEDLPWWFGWSEEQGGFARELHQWSERVGVPIGDHPWACIALWGDSAPSFKRDSVYLLSWRLLNGQCRRRFWVACFGKSQMCKCGCYGRHTLQSIFSVLAWSMRALMAGEYPAVDHLNREFPAGSYRAQLAGKPLQMRGAVITKVGDWQWLKSALNLTGWQGEGEQQRICWMCQASKKGPIDPFDSTAEAAWRRTRTDNTDYWQEAREDGKYVSPIFELPGFRIEYCRPDFMHTCCLGVVQKCSGSVMWQLFKQLGGTYSKPTDAIGKLQNLMKTASKHLRVEAPFHSLTIGMIRGKGLKSKPKLALKAAEGRHFVPVLHFMLQNFFECATDTQKMRLGCVGCLKQIYEEMKDWKEDTSPLTMIELARAHLIQYKALHAEQDDMFLFALSPKHHLFLHCVEGTRGNPSLEWCYGDESEIGECADLTRSCNPTCASRSVVAKYRATFKL
jgi:hypothetical protein